MLVDFHLPCRIYAELRVVNLKKCLAFTWKTRKFQMENQMVCIIPFGVFLNLWASGQSDAFLLLLLEFTLECPHTLHVFHLPLREAKLFRIYAENFHPGGLRKW